MKDSVIYNLLKSSKAGLIQVQRQVNKNGKTFTQHFWVKPSDVKSSDVVLSKPNANSDGKSTSANPDPKKAMIELLSQYSRDDLIAHAKANRVSWTENPREGINWMRASMAIQKAVKENPDAWETTRIGSRSNDNSKQENAQQGDETTQKTQPEQPEDTKTKEIQKEKPDEVKQKVKELSSVIVKKLSSTMGKEGLTKMAEENGITWNNHPNNGVNFMRMKMALAQAIQEGKIDVND